MAETEITSQLDNIVRTQSWQENESRLSSRIANILGGRTLALVELDSSFDPDTYDPAFDEADYVKNAA